MKENILIKLRIGGLLVSMFIGAGSWILDLAEVPFLFDWRWATFIAMLLFFALVWWHIWTLQETIGSKTPNLILSKRDGEHNPYINSVNFRSGRNTPIITPSGGVLKQGVGRMAHVRFANEPKVPTELNDAKNVRAEITYYDIAGRRFLGPIDGRWGDSKEPGDLKPDERKAIESITIPSNGSPRSVDIALRYPYEDDWYAYNNTSYFSPTNDFKQDSLKLKGDEVYVRVVLRGQVFDQKEFWFTLYKVEKDIQIVEGKQK